MAIASGAPNPFSAQTTTVDVPGVYPTGAAGIMREWDGQAWTDNAYLDARADALPPWPRSFFSFVASSRFWLWVGCLLISVVLGVLYLTTRSGALLILSGVIGSGGTLIAFYWMIAARLDLFRFVSKPAVIWLGLLGGVVGFAIAYPAELFVNSLLDAAPNSVKGYLFTGPIEETSKLVVPLVLYAFGMFREPIRGFAVALGSAAAFGWLEGIEYVAELALELPRLAHSAEAQLIDQIDVATTVSRPFTELLHVILVGFVAATAWRLGWTRGKFLPALIGAGVIAAILHSLNDMSQSILGLGMLVFPVIALGSFFLLTLPAIRQLTPPHQLGYVHPIWRPTLSKTAKAKLAAPPIG